LNILNTELAKIVLAKDVVSDSVEHIRWIAYDTRRIVQGAGAVFFSLQGTHTDGHVFIANAYEKGIRNFVVSKKLDYTKFPKATFIYVDDVQEALFLLALHYRKTLQGHIVLISGGIGKTSVKEWLYALLSSEFRVSRSPKSYNSTLGVMLSILGASVQSDVILIEVKPHVELDANKINSLILPNIGILTSIQNELPIDYFSKLFKGCSSIYHVEDKHPFFVEHTTFHSVPPLQQHSLFDKSKLQNVALAQAVAHDFGISKQLLQQKIAQLPELALRMETFDGKNGNFIINDIYNLDITAFRNSLEFQKAIAQDKQRTLVINIEQTDQNLINQWQELISEFQPLQLFFVDENTPENIITSLQNNVILVKGRLSKKLKRIVYKLKRKQHPTELRIDLKALRKNIAVYRKLLPRETKLMAMLKATGYGSGIDKIARFIDGFGVDYFGVAFVDEGVALRKAEVDTPIMVMNVDSSAYQNCIANKLEPAIFDLRQLDEFIAECIYQNITNYPIHIKINTGMNRLGFEPSEIDQVLEIIHAQPEVMIKSVYSHLAEADNVSDRTFTNKQIEIFQNMIHKIRQSLTYDFETHIANSSGIENFSTNNFSMSRLGIGMYGVATNLNIQKLLTPVVSWYSVVGQIRKLSAGQTVGYGRTFTCEKETIVATIPVGYADGLPRMLSNGIGYVTINNVKCPIIGKICMDMTMVDASHANAKIGDEVEIIGKNCSLQQMAELQKTIPYEVMTSIAERVHKVYIE